MAHKSTNTAPKLFLVVLIVALIAVAAWYLMPKGDQVPEHIGSGNGLSLIHISEPTRRS